jgi:hypothetical protein
MSGRCSQTAGAWRRACCPWEVSRTRYTESSPSAMLPSGVARVHGRRRRCRRRGGSAMPESPRGSTSGPGPSHAPTRYRRQTAAEARRCIGQVDAVGPWSPLAEWSRLSDQGARELGTVAGRVSKALRAFDEAPLHRRVEWDPRLAVSVAEQYLPQCPAEVRELVDAALSRTRAALPDASSKLLPCQVVHLDVTDLNVVGAFDTRGTFSATGIVCRRRVNRDPLTANQTGPFRDLLTILILIKIRKKG